MITSQEKLEELIQEWGFLPFFLNRIEGFSIEEHTPKELWFTDEQMAGPWEWKGPIISNWQCLGLGKRRHPQSRSTRIALTIDGEEATDIQFVTTEPQHAERTNGTLYDLQGRRVSQPSKGLYISNGHKYIIK